MAPPPLLADFEWAYGHDKRFGLVRVDHDTQERTVKTSGADYVDLIPAHRAALSPGSFPRRARPASLGGHGLS